MISTLFDTSRGDVKVSLPTVISGGAPSSLAAASSVMAAFANANASTDPGASNDSSQGYVFGSMWVNAAANAKRTWICVDATAGAAKWSFLGADFASGGTAPNTEAVQAGSSTASISAEGNVYREALAVPGRNPSGSGASIIIGVYTLPASFFDGAALPNGTATSNRSLLITAMGSLGANGNTRRIQMVIGANGTIGGVVGGGSVIADTGAITTNGSGWFLGAKVTKVGAAGSNTQVGAMQPSQAGASALPLIAAAALTLTESAAINIMLVVNCTTLATDVGLLDFEVAALN